MSDKVFLFNIVAGSKTKNKRKITEMPIEPKIEIGAKA